MHTAKRSKAVANIRGKVKTDDNPTYVDDTVAAARTGGNRSHLNRFAPVALRPCLTIGPAQYLAVFASL